ncbi:hypothetical protein KAU87_02610 [Candidatus Bathyarchaeota archaeon]|nr:hypothetical protein [Candidatus Bathyarchaeota archaeon]
MVDHFHVIADSNRRRDKARGVELDVRWKRKIQIPKQTLLTAGEKPSEETRQKLNGLLEKCPSLKGFCWAKDKDGGTSGAGKRTRCG